MLRLSKEDARRAWVAYSLRQGSLEEVFGNLRSVQYDALSPAGRNHDLVLQARVPGYRVDDWRSLAYSSGRHIYDGWDKQACLVPMEGWPVRRIFYDWAESLPRFRREHPEAVEAVLSELRERGPMAPKDFEFQEHRPEWRGSWYGPNMTKQVLRGLWHGGEVMTADRRGQHHVYDLTERVVPETFRSQPKATPEEAVRELVLDRHLAVGLLRPSGQQEVWSLRTSAAQRRQAIAELVDRGDLIPVDVDGVAAHAPANFARFLDAPRPTRTVFLGPLDQLMWDRTMVRHVFDFDYVWEVYKPESERRWGYYSLPVLRGDRIVARFDPWLKREALEVRAWHWEPDVPITPSLREAVDSALETFCAYAGANSLAWQCDW